MNLLFSDMFTLCLDKNWTPKEIVIIQQNCGTFVWNFRRTNNKANQLEKTILNDKDIQDIVSFLNVKNATLKIQSFKQSTVSPQSVTVSKANSGCTTADVQSDLLVLERITADMDTIAWWPSRWSCDQTSVTLQLDVSWGDWRHECGCDTRAAPVRSRCEDQQD